MDTLVNHFESYLGLYTLLVILLFSVGTVLAIDLLSPRLRRGASDPRDFPDHTSTIHMHHLGAGMGESGPDSPDIP